jgi:predicted nucleotidyltransferase
MSASRPGIAATIYHRAAAASAHLLSACPCVRSVLLHHSAATGEIRFGRSDIDLLMVIDQAAAGDGEKLMQLLRSVRRVRLVNPALSHVEVFEPDGIEELARTDTFWGSITRRTMKLLSGKAVAIPREAVKPDHALGRFLLWVEWFFSNSVQRRNRRNIRKTALECWNAYAVAEGLLTEPHLLRSEMEGHLRGMESGVWTERLEEPENAVRFVFELAHRLHNSRLPALGALREPMIFETAVAPLWLRRRFVVLPGAGSPLPPDIYKPGAFTCTPEVLNLYLHFKNAFFAWTLPPELAASGMKSPGVGEFLRECRYYSHNRFLCLAGFAVAHPPPEAARVACLRHALEWIARGEAPPALRPPETSDRRCSVNDYYRNQYGQFRLENQRLRESAGLIGAARQSF